MFPILYHAHHSLHLEDIPFWLSLARSRPDPVLELGCGTGRLLIPLLQAGHRVFGLDNDMGMLEILKTNMSGFPNFKSDVIRADLTAFHLGISFGLILLACNTYSTLEPYSRKMALKRVKDHLLPNGIFAVSLPNPLLLRQLPLRSRPEIEEIFAHPLDGELVQVSSEWRRDAQRFWLRWHYDHLLPHGEVERLSVEVIHQLTLLEEHLSEIQSVGLGPVRVFGDYDGSEYSSNSPEMILMISRDL